MGDLFGQNFIAASHLWRHHALVAIDHLQEEGNPERPARRANCLFLGDYIDRVSFVTQRRSAGGGLTEFPFIKLPKVFVELDFNGNNQDFLGASPSHLLRRAQKQLHGNDVQRRPC